MGLVMSLMTDSITVKNWKCGGDEKNINESRGENKRIGRKKWEEKKTQGEERAEKEKRGEPLPAS